MKRTAKFSLISKIMLAVLCLISFRVPLAESGPRTIVVTRDAASIQEAINSARVGDTILVPAGVYFENIIVDKPLFLLGESGETIIDGSTKPGDVIKIQDGVNNVTVKGFTIKGASEPFAGIRVDGSFNEISENSVIENFRGIYMYDSTGNVLRANQFAQNIINFAVWGLALSHFTHDIDVSNTVEGKPIYYWVNEHDKTVPSDAGYVAAINSSGISVKGVLLSNNEQGVLFAYTNRSRVENVTIWNNGRGIQLLFSHENIISGNEVLGSRYHGIDLHSSSNNKIEGNRVIKSGGSGIIIAGPGIIKVPSDNNTVQGNLLSNNVYRGVQIARSTGTRIYKNKIVKNGVGIYLVDSNNNSMFENRVFENAYGFMIRDSARNTIFHNNVENNTVQAYCYGFLTQNNNWDNGYPSGGNYWSDYLGLDDDHDGIGDTPYIIDADNLDRYPLMVPKKLNTAPVADFLLSPSTPVLFHEVQFISKSVDTDGEITSFLWDFGDGSNSTEENPFHIYEALGQYNVTLKIVDDENLASLTYQIINVRKIRTFLTIKIPQEAEIRKPTELVATLADEYGDPVPGEHVLFYLLKEDGEELIGNVTTDNEGVAKLLYLFSSAGSLRIKAAFPGSSFHEASSRIEQINLKSTPNAFYAIAFLVLIAVAGLTLFGIFSKKRKKSLSSTISL
jgi:parallel beta-helix repeat protein